MLKFTLLLVVVVSMGAGLHWMLSVSGSLQDLVEQYFVALTLLVLIPLVMPERKCPEASGFSSPDWPHLCGLFFRGDFHVASFSRCAYRELYLARNFFMQR